MIVSFTIREFVTPDDYQAAVDIQNAVQPMTPAVVADYAEGDRTWDAKCLQRRWLAEMDGLPVGMAQLAQFLWCYHPQRYNLYVRVIPAYRGRGIGSALYDTLMAAVAELDPLELRAGTSEDMPEGVRFARQRGFVEKMRFSESHLDLATFDPAPYAPVIERVKAQGITLTCARALAGDPDWVRKLWDLEWETAQDVPGVEDFSRLPLEQWQENLIESDVFLPEGYIVAHVDGEYIGQSALWADRASDMLYTGLTAVKREWRRRGVATAMKVLALTWGQANGNTIVKTDNEVNNEPMLAINRQLGFVKQPDQIDVVKVLREENGQ